MEHVRYADDEQLRPYPGCASARPAGLASSVDFLGVVASGPGDQALPGRSSGFIWLKFWRYVSFFFVVSQVGQLYAASAPQLAFSANAGQITLSWQDTNNWLQSSAALAPATWLNVTSLPMVTGTTNTLAVPADQAAGYYRLVYSPFLPPPTELNLDANEDALGNGYFILSWDAVPTAVSYNLYYATDPGVTKYDYLSVSNVMGITNLSQEVDGLMAGQHYYFVVTAVSGSGESADSNEAMGVFGAQAGVSGEIDTLLQFGTNLMEVALAGVSVTLSNLSDPTLGAQTVTDPDGGFEFAPQPAGNYQLCWSAPGFGPGCYSNAIALSNDAVDVGVILLMPPTNAGLVYGQVTLQDGSVPVVQDAFFNISITPVITLFNSNGGIVRVATPNFLGEYVMAGVPMAPNLTLSAQLQQSGVTTNIDGSVTGEADLVIPETPLTISNLVATLNGQPIVRVPGGTTVQVFATVGPTNHPLQYIWLQPDGTPLPGASGPNVNWTVPNDSDGYEYLFLAVTDGYGGFASDFVELTVNPYLVFSGQVVGSDTNAPPVTNAVVQLNTLVTNTDANGYFSFLVTATNEYDLTITAGGYLPLGKVYFDEAPDQEYVMLQILSDLCIYDASTNISVVTPAGVTVDIPPQVLVDMNGNGYTGCVSVAVNLMDPCAGSNPVGADYTSGGNLLDLASLADIDLEGTNGPLFLNGSATAQIFLPISASCAVNTNLLPVEQFYTFNVSSNRWVPIGWGTNVTATDGSIIGYQGAVAMLGEVGMGAKEDPAEVGTLELASDGTVPLPFRVQIIPGNAKRIYTDITPSNNKVPNVPFGDVAILILNPRQAPGEFYTNGTVLVPDDKKEVIQVIKVTLKAANLKVKVGLGKAPDNNQTRLATLTQNKAGAVFDENDVDTVLGRLLQRIANFFLPNKWKDGSEANAKLYYKAIDLGNKKDTFTKWQTQDKFITIRPKKADGKTIDFTGHPKDTLANAKAGDLEFGLYFNATDLGAGRRVGMNVWMDTDNQKSVAYYAATYPTLEDAVADKNVKYIACIDYALGGGGRIVRFYVFDGTGKQLTGINSEKQSAQTVYVPNVCMVCHGAGRKDPTQADVDGQFIAFDTANFTFTTEKEFSYPALTANAARAALPESGVAGNQNVFCSLNDGLLTGKRTMPTDLLALIKNLVKNSTSYYAGPAAKTDGFAQDWVNKNAAPADKKAQSTLYTGTYAVSCRSCHSTQRGIPFPTAAGFSGGRAAEKAERTMAASIMPQSQRAYFIFWGSHTGAFLNNTLNNAPYNRKQAVISQPASISDDTPKVK
jgi:hypothetical protein